MPADNVHAHGLPAQHLMADGWTKRVLREGLVGILPEPIRKRVDKKAFALPEAPWANGELRDEFRQRLVAATAGSGGVFTGRLVTGFDLVATGRAPYHPGFWRAVSFDAWRRVFRVDLEHASPCRGDGSCYCLWIRSRLGHHLRPGAHQPGLPNRAGRSSSIRALRSKPHFLEAGLSVGASFALIVPLWRGWPLNQGLVCWMAANVLRLGVVWWYVGRPFVAARPAWDRELTREVWSFLWPIQLSRLPGIVMAYFDKVVTSVFLSKPDFAAYSLGARHLPFVGTIPGSVSSVMLPRLVEAFQQNDVDRLCSLWRRACLSTALLTYPVAAFCIWHAKPLIRAMFTSTYEAGAIPFATYAGITIIRVVDYGSLARALNQTTITLRVVTYTLCLSLPLTVALTWAVGIWGVSVSLLLSSAIAVVLYLWTYARQLQRPLQSFFPLMPLAAILVIAFGAVVLANLLLAGPLAVASQTTVRELLPRLGALFLVSTGHYVGGVWLLRMLRPEWVLLGK